MASAAPPATDSDCDKLLYEKATEGTEPAAAAGCSGHHDRSIAPSEPEITDGSAADLSAPQQSTALSAVDSSGCLADATAAAASTLPASLTIPS